MKTLRTSYFTHLIFSLAHFDYELISSANYRENYAFILLILYYISMYMTFLGNLIRYSFVENLVRFCG